MFVFAVSQLSGYLLHDLTWRGAAKTLVLLCAVFTVWPLTTFEATHFNITRRHTQAAVLTAMALWLFMAAIGVAFTGGGGWAFVVPLVVTQIARGIITAKTAPTPLLRQDYRRALTWLLASTQSREIAFDYAHMAERLRPFLLIALDEVIATSATAIAEAPTESLMLLAGGSWWVH